MAPFAVHVRGSHCGWSLGSTSRGVADIAEDVGYESEAAFNRAFKREFGLPPARYAESKELAVG